MKFSLYVYKGKVVKVYDGDTCTVDIDLGLRAWVKGEKIRLARINTPEIRGDERPEGLKARDYLRERILDKDIFIETIKDKKGKYGRYLGEIWIEDKVNKFININDELVKKGFAVYVEY